MNDELMPLLQLSRAERPVNKVNPWKDDKLGREMVAKKLTRVIGKEQGPLTVSVDGAWGTGKTFLLKRWQQQLKNDGFECIYFNAWSDDFHGEPLIAMIGQLAESLEDDKYEKFISSIKELAVPLIGLGADLHIGVPVAGAMEKLQEIANKKMDAYYKQAATKRELSKKLKKMAHAVKEETYQPLVFIIDELDRCRPTFAVELLERVKHIFDIPNIIFVFGINRTELCKAVESVYGNIDSDTYLRRFFDLSLTLPAASADKFCGYLAQEYRLHEFFAEVGKIGDAERRDAYGDLVQNLTMLVKLMNLSLRDIDNCIKVTVMAGKNMNVKDRIFAIVIVALIVLRLSNRSLYEEFMQGKCFSSNVIDYFDEKVDELDWQDRKTQHAMSLIEFYLIWVDNGNSVVSGNAERTWELEEWHEGIPNQSVYLSSRAQSETERRQFLEDFFAQMGYNFGYMRTEINHFADLIDLVTIEHH